MASIGAVTDINAEFVYTVVVQGVDNLGDPMTTGGDTFTLKVE